MPDGKCSHRPLAGTGRSPLPLHTDPDTATSEDLQPVAVAAGFDTETWKEAATQMVVAKSQIDRLLDYFGKERDTFELKIARWDMGVDQVVQLMSAILYRDAADAHAIEDAALATAGEE